MKKFLCTKDCIESCFTLIDEDLNIYPEERETGTNFVCSKLKKFFKKEVLNPDKSFLKIENRKYFVENSEIIKSLSNKLSESKNDRILYIRGSGSLGYMMSYWDTLFSHFPNIYFIEGSLCLSTGESAHLEDFGEYINPPLRNLTEVNNIVIFGRDAHNVAPHLYSFIKKLKKSGKKVIYIDPIFRKTSQIADKYIRIKPASDNFLSAAILKLLNKDIIDCDLDTLLSKTGISMNELELLADSFSNGKNGIITGYGLQRYVNGKNIVQWINRLAHFTNNLDYLYYVRSSKEGLPKPAIQNPKINISEILSYLQKGFFRGAIIVASNPLISYPSSAKLKKEFENLDFLMVVDTYESETAKIATHFIKVGGMFAQEDLSGSYFYDAKFHIRDKIVDQPSDLDIIKAIAKNLNIPLDPQLPSKPPKSYYKGRTYKTKNIPLIENVPNGIRLITGSHYSYLNSQRFDNFNENYIYISNDDAKELGINDGDTIILWNENGNIKGRSRISELCGKGYIFCYKCQTLIDGHPNILTNFTPTDSNTGIALYDTFVKIKKL